MSEIEPEEFVEEPFIPSQLTPLDDEPLTPEEMFRLAEEDIEERPETTDVLVEPPPPIGRGWALDPNKPGFVMSPQHRGPLTTHGLGTLRTWITKVLHTERGVFPIYSTEFGMTRPFDLIGQPGSETAVADYEDRVRDALLFHPRITEIREFRAEFALSTDEVQVWFEVVTDTHDILEIEERVMM